MIGLPFASLPISAGTQAAPDVMRVGSRTMSWLDFQKEGGYSDMVLTDGRPEIIGQGIVVEDGGDLDCAGGSPADLFHAVQARVSTLTAHDTRPLFIGGDHALTYPVFAAMQQAEPRLGLLHLDAHNDLFYQGDIAFNHAAFLSNILKDTAVERVASFGLRTALDQRVAHMERAYDQDDVAERVTLVPMTRLRQLLASEGGLEQMISGLQGRPYYLTIDLDVLSETAIAGQVSTPCGAGLEWHELHTLLSTVFKHLDVRGADVVEFNPCNGTGGADRQINAMLVRIIDGLAKSSGKPRLPPVQAQQNGGPDGDYSA
eukprot:CAMPEP_0184417092 /NCGR_PEP_ID=MMETSP0738-20130409/9986_1 /TAXON_ID=385413 /ORGANISM="Thalassiosira miniscula, Strain CCMP1093" /LENGTH=315 /DNA_ID=CAMNT_0026776709 /DNA_START=17 /DNA_END=961 /DNA_ORIENTATION=+